MPPLMPQSRHVHSSGGSGRSRAEPDADRHVHIVLLGLMGAGKSTVGRLVANELGRPFVDSDSIVELRTGALPPGVVERSGVSELHEHERAAFRQVVDQRDSVVFAAAASIVDDVDRDDLQHAWCVWLDAPPAVLAERAVGDDHDRPLLGDQPRQVLAEHHAARSARGRELADLSIDTEGRTPDDIAAEVCSTWRAWAG